MKFSTYISLINNSTNKKKILIEINYQWQKLIKEEIGVIHHLVHINVNFLRLSKS